MSGLRATVTDDDSLPSRLTRGSRMAREKERELWPTVETCFLSHGGGKREEERRRNRHRKNRYSRKSVTVKRYIPLSLSNLMMLIVGFSIIDYLLIMMDL